MRDPEGNTIKDGEIIAADQYPWLSKDGSMLFMETGGDMLFYKDEETSKVTSRYPVRCAVDDDCALDYVLGSRNENDIARLELHRHINRRALMVGSWTHGKMVIMDNVVNYMDYGPDDAIGQHLWVKIYESTDKTGLHQNGEVLMAHNKQEERSIPGTVSDGAQMGSTENRFNHIPEFKPITPKDLVWLFSKGNGVTTEIVFDDFVAHDVLIYAQMNEAFSNKDALSSELQGVHDGFVRMGNLYGKGFSQENPVRLQNAATITPELSDTSDFMRVPPYGNTFGKVRIEPYALGGIRGKGFWLNGSSGISFDLPKQRKKDLYEKNDWYIGIFLDQRHSEKDEKKLLTLPNGSSVWLDDSVLVFKYPDSSVLARVEVRSAKQAWQHVGITIEANTLGIYIDGLRIKTLNNIDKRFALTEGVLAIGKTQKKQTGFRGWVDDFKVIAINSDTSQERFCEHARGTLVSFLDSEEGVNKQIIEKAIRAEKSWKAEIQQELIGHNGNSDKHVNYYCYTNYASENGANLAEIPENTQSIRLALLQPQEIVFDQPRPDQSKNAFCLSCHDDGLHSQLSIEALKKHNIPAHSDPRQQPMEAPRGLFVNQEVE